MMGEEKKEQKKKDLSELAKILAEDFKKRGRVFDEGIYLNGINGDEKIGSMKAPGKVFSKKGQAEIFNLITPIFYDKNNLWWIWNDKTFAYELTDEIHILNVVEENTGEDIITGKNRQEIINALKQEGRRNIPLPIKPTWIQFKETIVDIETGEEFPASPFFFVVNPIPYSLHKHRFVNTPIMDSIFKEWVGEKHVKTLYQIIAYCLIPSYPIHRIFCFLGGGMNGKSSFLDLLTKFLGEKNVTTTELDLLTNSRFEVTRLHKKLACIMGETNFNEMNKTSLLKQMSSGDLLPFEYKHKLPFSERNYAKIIIATNNLPATSDKTIGFYRRWLLIDFPNMFSEKEDVLKRIPEEEYEILAVKSLSILHELLQERAFYNEGSIEERTLIYEGHSDPVQKFMNEYCDFQDVNGSIPKWEFLKRLKEWLREKRYREVSEIVLSKKMKERGVENSRKTVDYYDESGIFKKKVERVWVGIQWKGGKN